MVFAQNRNPKSSGGDFTRRTDGRAVSRKIRATQEFGF
jgi:hypothetical protein